MNKRLIISAGTIAALVAFTSCSWAVKPINSEVSLESSSSVSESASESSSSAVETASNAYDHTFNPHVISQMFVDKYGEQFKEDYFKYCDAILAGADSVECSKGEWLLKFQDIARSCLPIVSEYCYNSEDSFPVVSEGVYKLYYSIPKDEYLKKVDEFKARVETLIENCILSDDSELEKALALYLSESARIDYDYDAVGADNYRSAEGYGVSPYRSLMTDKGICQEIAGTYAYLLLQVGVDAISVSGLTKDCTTAHEWTIVRLDGKLYHCDVTFQCTNKFSVQYFGMTDAEREKQGDWDMPYNNIGGTNDLWARDYPALDDTKFEQFWTCYNCLLDREENKIFCYDKSGTEDANYFTLDV